MSEESEVENCNGFRFCKQCGKLCIPLKAENEQNVMLFKCEQCDVRRCVINLNIREDQVIKKTQVLQSEAADIKNKALGEDPSMPRRNLFCRYCQKDQEIVYYYKAGNEQKNIVTQFICKETGYSWTSDEQAKLVKEGKQRDPLPDNYKLEDDEFQEPEEKDQDDDLYGNISDSDNNRRAFKNNDEFDEDEIFGEDEDIKEMD